MSVVGLTSGSAANATRPSAASAARVATRASDLRRRVRALVPGESPGQRQAEQHERRRLPADHALTAVFWSRRISSAPCSGSSAPPAPPSTRAVSVAKYHPPLSTSRGRRVDDHPPVGEHHHALGERRRELRVVRRDNYRASPTRRCAHQIREYDLGLAIHATGRLVQAERRRRRVAGADDRQRQALTLATAQIPRVAPGQRREPGLRQRPLPQLVGDPLRQEVVARILEQERHPAAAVDGSPGRLQQALRVAQERRLPRPVAAHQGDRLAGRDLELDPPQDRRPVAQLVPDPREAERRLLGAAPAGSPRPRLGRRRRRRRRRGRLGQQVMGAQRRPRLLDPRRRRPQADPPHEPGRRRLERRRVVGRPVEEDARSRVADEPTAGQREHPVGRLEAAFEAVLDQHDRRPPLLVESPQERDQLVGRDRVELRGRLVEEDHLRPAGQRRREGDPLLLAAAQLTRRPLEQAFDAQRERRLLDPPGDPRRPVAAILERKGELGSDRPHQDLRLRVLEQGPRDRGHAPGPCSRVSSPPTVTRPAKSPPWKCGTRPQAARSTVDLPDAERPATTQNSPGSIPKLSSRRTGVAASPSAQGYA